MSWRVALASAGARAVSFEETSRPPRVAVNVAKWPTTVMPARPKGSKSDVDGQNAPWTSRACRTRDAPSMSTTTHAYTGDVDSRCVRGRRIDLDDLVLGRQGRQAAALEHEAGHDGSSHEDHGGPEEGRRVAMEQRRLEIGRGESSTHQVGRGSTSRHRIEQRRADRSPHLLGRVER